MPYQSNAGNATSRYKSCCWFDRSRDLMSRYSGLSPSMEHGLIALQQFQGPCLGDNIWDKDCYLFRFFDTMNNKQTCHLLYHLEEKKKAGNGEKMSALGLHFCATHTNHDIWTLESILKNYQFNATLASTVIIEAILTIQLNLQAVWAM